ncbi:ATP-binding protein, partial [Candidatus Pelagibacter sp.]|nr:ATP-binding protein [Candidatus Pelagibacter sp.]
EKVQKNGDFDKKIIIEFNNHDNHINITIDDNGVGFKNVDMNKKEILNPYFTTKKNGTGLGLSIVNKIINDHDGNINFKSKDDGAIIKINLNK